jgi:hypothetical protein
VRLEGLGKLKIAMTSSGMEPTNFRLIALCLENVRYRVPLLADITQPVSCRMPVVLWRLTERYVMTVLTISERADATTYTNRATTHSRTLPVKLKVMYPDILLVLRNTITITFKYNISFQNPVEIM